MEDKNTPPFPHLLLEGTSKTERYTSPKSGGPKIETPIRNRQDHGTFLKRQFERIQEEDKSLKHERAAYGIDVGKGICLQFESDPDFPLKLESLESFRAGIELLAVRELDRKTYATVFVPEGELSHFVKQIDKYLTEQTKKGNPKNQPLINSISDIHKAAVKALWTDDDKEFPADGKEIWWEVWLRAGKDRDSILEFFRNHSEKLGLRIRNGEIKFPDRTIVLTYGNKDQMSKSIDLLNCIAELRKAKETSEVFVQMTPTEQTDWVEEALSRLKGPAKNAPSVCILDSGVNNGHPLIAPALNLSDMHSYDPAWNVADHKGHGTEMAGLALYDDLTRILLSSDPIKLTHILESVKILPPDGQNDPELYGHITIESIARAEVTAPNRNRVACMAVTTTDFRDRGQPSSWSAAIDNMSSGADDGQRRLIIVAAGNTNLDSRIQYPACNMTDGIHDPGQAWNALTIGAYTEKIQINQDMYPGWTPIAPQGDLSPSSCTSVPWARQWPIKPDVVIEGGNMAHNPGTKTVDYVDSLQLLTTYYHPASKQFVTTGDTSAATAIASRMSAIIYANYPDFRPETVRALIVHSADWNEAMKIHFSNLTPRNKTENLLRYCGFGVPNLADAIWSASNSLTLIVQDELQPFNKDGSEYKTHDMHLHSIPWPVEILQDLGESPVEMKVTLSYFIEPNPARRGWKRRHIYASHGLRFDVKTATESDNEFRSRINKAARDEESGKTSESDASNWLLGPTLRGRGSIHSDRWVGTAVDLASRGLIGVYPVIGWWRERHQLGRWDKKARYSLVVTIKTPESEVDIYTPVANKIKVSTRIKT